MQNILLDEETVNSLAPLEKRAFEILDQYIENMDLSKPALIELEKKICNCISAIQDIYYQTGYEKGSKK